MRKIKVPTTVTEIQNGTFAECSSLEELTYLGDSEISNDIELSEGVTVYVRESYPYEQIGGRTVTQIKSSGRLGGGAIAGIVIGSVALVAIIAGCVYYFAFRRTRDSLSEDEKEAV